MHVILKSADSLHPVVYLFSEDWKRSIDTMVAALPLLELTRPPGKRTGSRSASQPLPGLRQVVVEYDKCLKSGYVEKREFVEGHKWERQYLLLTRGHLVWFLNKEERDKETPRTCIELTKIKECRSGPVPGDDTISHAVFIVLEDATYLFYDCTRLNRVQEYWRDTISFAIEQMNPNFV